MMSYFIVRKYKKGQLFAEIDRVSNKIGFIIDGLFYMNVFKGMVQFLQRHLLEKNLFYSLHMIH